MKYCENLNFKKENFKSIPCVGQQTLHKPSRFQGTNKNEIQAHLNNELEIFLANGGKIKKGNSRKKEKKIKITESIFS